MALSLQIIIQQSRDVKQIREILHVLVNRNYDFYFEISENKPLK